jgi:hypothetical protein
MYMNPIMADFMAAKLGIVSSFSSYEKQLISMNLLQFGVEVKSMLMTLHMTRIVMHTMFRTTNF